MQFVLEGLPFILPIAAEIGATISESATASTVIFASGFGLAGGLAYSRGQSESDKGLQTAALAMSGENQFETPTRKKAKRDPTFTLSPTVQRPSSSSVQGRAIASNKVPRDIRWLGGNTSRRGAHRRRKHGHMRRWSRR